MGQSLTSPEMLATQDDPQALAVIDQWIADSVAALVQPLVAVTTLFDPDAILIGGRLPADLNTRLAAAIGEDTGTLEDVYEPYLIKNGFLMRTPTGRVVTDLAYHHLGIDKPSDED